MVEPDRIYWQCPIIIPAGDYRRLILSELTDPVGRPMRLGATLGMCVKVLSSTLSITAGLLEDMKVERYMYANGRWINGAKSIILRNTGTVTGRYGIALWGTAVASGTTSEVGR